MTRAWLSLAVLVGTSGWFFGLAPPIAGSLDSAEQPKAPPKLRLMALRARADAQSQALLDELDAVTEAEDEAYRLIAKTLTKKERALGQQLQADLPPIQERSAANAEVVALAKALMATHGYAYARPQDGADRAYWPGADPSLQTRSVLALVRAGELDDRQAAIILTRVLELLELQTRKAEIYDALQLLDEG